MKKAFVVVLAVILAVALVGCGFRPMEKDTTATEEIITNTLKTYSQQELRDAGKNMAEWIDQLTLDKDKANEIFLTAYSQGTGIPTEYTTQDKALIFSWIDFLRELDLDEAVGAYEAPLFGARSYSLTFSSPDESFTSSHPLVILYPTHVGYGDVFFSTKNIYIVYHNEVGNYVHDDLERLLKAMGVTYP